jgi:hypothetical protein
MIETGMKTHHIQRRGKAAGKTRSINTPATTRSIPTAFT